IKRHVRSEDFLPRRARFSADPAPLAVAMAMMAAEARGEAGVAEVRPGVGTPRSLLARLAQRFGKSAEETALMAALSRAVGLWDATASSPSTPPGSLRIAELSSLLF